MSSPNTRPGEIARVARLANGDAAEYRTEVLILLIESREAAKRHEAWQLAHDKLDNDRHYNLLQDIEALKDGLGGATSGISDYRKDRYTFDGMKIAIYSIIGSIITILGLAIAAGYIGQ